MAWQEPDNNHIPRLTLTLNLKNNTQKIFDTMNTTKLPQYMRNVSAIEDNVHCSIYYGNSCAHNKGPEITRKTRKPHKNKRKTYMPNET